MRKIPVLLATLGLVLAGALFPVASAQAASANCDDQWRRAASGHFYAYDFSHCSTKLGNTSGDDPNWADSSGGFRGDSNKASSILHKGTSGMAVKVYNGVGYNGAYSCIKKSELYVSDLSDDYLTGGVHPSDRVTAYNTISSHKWVQESACAGAFLH